MRSRKRRLKLVSVEKPAAPAMSATVRCVSRSRRQACSTRRSLIKSVGGRPVARLKKRLKAGGVMAACFESCARVKASAKCLVAYPEHDLPSHLESDVERLRASGVNVVRMAEFAWDLMEPREGEFDFSFFEQHVNRLGDAGIRTILCTPTATPPAHRALGFAVRRENCANRRLGTGAMRGTIRTRSLWVVIQRSRCRVRRTWRACC